jgi:hypothetical protein
MILALPFKFALGPKTFFGVGQAREESGPCVAAPRVGSNDERVQALSERSVVSQR